MKFILPLAVITMYEYSSPWKYRNFKGPPNFQHRFTAAACVTAPPNTQSERLFHKFHSLSSI